MNKAILMVPAMVVGLMMSQGAFAQSGASTGAKAGAATTKPEGEQSPQMKKMPSTRTRAEASAECVEMLKSGKGPSGECSPGPEGTSTKTRAQVKAECAKDLVAAGKNPSGECSN